MRGSRPVTAAVPARATVALTVLALALTVTAAAAPAAVLVATAAALGSGLVVLALAPRLRGVDRAGFVLIAVGQLGAAPARAAASVWSGTGSSDVVPALAAALALLSSACVVGGAAVLLLPPQPHRSRRWSLAVDGALVAAAAFVVTWVFGWQRVVTTDRWPLPGHLPVVVLGRAATAVELLGAALAVGLWVSRRPGERLAPRLVAVAVVLAVVADTGPATPARLAGVGTAVLWTCSAGLLMVAPAAAAGRDLLPRRCLDPDRVLVPVVLLVGAAVSLGPLASPQGLSRLPLDVSGAVVLALLARLASVARSNQRLAEALQGREHDFRSLVDTAPDLLLRLDLAGRVTYVSPSAERLLRVAPDALCGRGVAELVEAGDAAKVEAALRALRTDPAAGARLQVGVRRGALLTRVHLEAVANRVGEDVVVAVRDVSETVALRQQLARAARTDALTGLANRSAFEAELRARFATLRPGEQVAVLVCDLDGFKRINDSRGHGVGDALLVETARRVRAAVGPSGLACRFGGDEFTVLLAPGNDVPAAVTVAERVRLALARPFTSPAGGLVLGASIGVAAAGAGRRPSDLVRDADVAMHHAKALGRGLVQVFEPAMYDALARSVDLEQRLHAAVERQALSVLYQPVVDLTSGAVVSAEALLRWTDGDRTVVEAGELVALAESSGDIHAIGRWVLDQALAQAAAWAAGGYPLRVAVNLSVHQVAVPGLVAVVDEALRRHGVPADRLTLEITETVLLDQAETTLTSVERLRGLGVHLAVDDFGTGYSSLDYLRRLPVDQLKIDRSFLDGFGRLDDVTALVRAVIGLGHDLGLSVTVEGVESAHHVRLLREAGAEHAQGYAFARALDVASMDECLRAGPFVLAADDDVLRMPRVADQWASHHPDPASAS